MDFIEQQSRADRPSKTSRKRAMCELQSLGEELVDLPEERVASLALPEELHAALVAARRMLRHDDARRRQMQYIGRLMRQVDAQPIRDLLASEHGELPGETAQLHRCERLRSELLADERQIFRIGQEFPAADLQRLRSLRRAALLEQAQGRPPRSFRAIFQLLKAAAADGARTLPLPTGDEEVGDDGW